jgi:hypothetical protein
MDRDQLIRQNLVAQWAFDTRAILGRFHVWLEDVKVEWIRGKPVAEFTEPLSFAGGRIERQIAMTVAMTALGTKLYGRYGGAAGENEPNLNQVKKDADAVSAYAMSESLWYLSRMLPENHAIMVSLGEGLMPKGGETPEMGSNPQLGFGRVYARPSVAKWLDERVIRLLNKSGYTWAQFYSEIKEAGITVWGAAIDTLENTSRFAKGAKTGPMTVLHLFNQPLRVARPYEGYMGNLLLPAAIVRKAAEQSVLIDFRTPRAKIVEAIEATYPGIQREHIHVWTLRGKNRTPRIGSLWNQWEALGVHLVTEDWIMPSGMAPFTDSGTYAPTYAIKAEEDDQGRTHVFLCDGYAASAEAVQAASLGPMLDVSVSLAVLTSKFKLDVEREQQVMHLDPHGLAFASELEALLGEPPSDEVVADYRRMIEDATDASVPLDAPVIGADDFFPEKSWGVLAASGYMSPDPYSGAAGVEEIKSDTYKVTVRLASNRGDKRIAFWLRLTEEHDVSRLMFNPLLVRFFQGEEYTTRAVKISDSGRIRNELQTLCMEALDFSGDQRMLLNFDRIPTEVISPKHRRTLLEVLSWYKEQHPLWFDWLKIVAPSK